MTNREIADLFAKVADMLAIRGDNIHRVLAYRRASEAVQGLGRDINQVYEEGTLTDIPGIGKTLAEKIEEMLTTGELEFYTRLSQDVPPSLVEMLRVDGDWTQSASNKFMRRSDITTLDELTVAASEGKLRDIPGLGAKVGSKDVARY